jgi:hypothetical protein
MIIARFIPAVPAAALLLASAAHAETRTSALVGVEGGYGSNPFFDSNTQNQDTGTIILTAAPNIALVGPTSNLNLSGRLEQTFITRYSGMTNWSLGADGSVRVSPRTSLSLGAAYASRVNNGLNTSISAVPPDDPAAPLPDPSTTEAGGQRTKTFSSRAGLSSQISARDSVTFGATFVKADYPAIYNSSNKSYSGTVSFLHVFGERTSAGLGLTYSKTDYDQPLFGSFKAFSPSLNVSLKLAPRTTLNVSAGATFNSIDSTTLIPGSKKALFSGSLTLCHTGDRSSFCLAGSRSVGATSQTGGSTITLASANYNYKLSPRSSIQLAANYSTSKSTGLVTGFETSYAGGSAGYSHQLSQRLSLTVNARYTDPIKSVGARRNSFYGGVGVTYLFGR